MPFITEEIYHLLKEQNEDLIVKQFEKNENPDHKILKQGNILKEAITSIRDAKNKNQIKPKEKIKLHIQTDKSDEFYTIESILSKQLIADIFYTNDAIANSVTVVQNKNKFYIETEQPFNTGSQKDQLLKDLDHLKGFLNSVEKKLSNERFVQNAKSDVIQLERKKKRDTEIKIKIIEDSLSTL